MRHLSFTSQWPAPDKVVEPTGTKKVHVPSYRMQRLFLSSHIPLQYVSSPDASHWKSYFKKIKIIVTSRSFKLPTVRCSTSVRLGNSLLKETNTGTANTLQNYVVNNTSVTLLSIIIITSLITYVLYYCLTPTEKLLLLTVRFSAPH